MESALWGDHQQSSWEYHISVSGLPNAFWTNRQRNLTNPFTGKSPYDYAALPADYTDKQLDPPCQPQEISHHIYLHFTMTLTWFPTRHLAQVALLKIWLERDLSEVGRAVKGVSVYDFYLWAFHDFCLWLPVCAFYLWVPVCDLYLWLPICDFYLWVSFCDFYLWVPVCDFYLWVQVCDFYLWSVCYFYLWVPVCDFSWRMLVFFFFLNPPRTFWVFSYIDLRS